MSTRNLDALFAPRSVVLVGADERPGSLGAVLARNLLGSAFAGPVSLLPAHAAAAALPEGADLAVLAAPPAATPGLVAALGARGCRAAVVVPPGFGEGGDPAGIALREQLLQAARPHTLRVLGPNCLGLLSPARGLNASSAPLAPLKGDVAFVTQSGAVAMSVLDWAHGRGLGFSHVVSLGDTADVDVGDLLDHLALDTATRAILLYVESITEARKFMSAGRIAARAKPVVLVKGGTSRAGARATLAHTGLLAGTDPVHDAAFRRAGMLRVATLRELFDAARILASGARVRGDRLAIISNSGGVAVLAADALERLGGTLAELPDPARDALAATLSAPDNPLDLGTDADGERYRGAVDTLRRHGAQDAILALHAPTGASDGAAVADALLRAPRAGAPLLTCWLGSATARPIRQRLAEKHLPAYEMPEEAVRGFLHLVRYRRNQEQLMQTPAAGALVRPEHRARAATLVRDALAAGRDALNEPEAKALLSAYGIPVMETRVAHSAAEAGRQASALGGARDAPMVLKILSPDIPHKSDVGGVRLDLRNAWEVRIAASEMLRQVTAAAPGARIDGFTVQRMAGHRGTHELMAGIATDPVFGPVVLFGAGGVAVEVVRDQAVGLPPLNLPLAQDLIDRTRIAALLRGFRNVPGANLEAVAMTLIRLSEMAVDLPELAELDINPLLADAGGVVALDARAALRVPEASRRLAVPPYPAELETTLAIPDGRRFRLRPIRPEDEPALVEMVRRSSPEDLRLRFFGAITRLTHEMAARLSQIDYDREMAFIALQPGPGGEEIVGVVRFVGDADMQQGEYAVLARSDFKGQGLGYRLMRTILDYARHRGLRRLFGDVLRENTTMLRMARQLGGEVAASPEDPAIVRVTFDLSRPEVASGGA